jgi:hypothetical protein
MGPICPPTSDVRLLLRAAVTLMMLAALWFEVPVKSSCRVINVSQTTCFQTSGTLEILVTYGQDKDNRITGACDMSLGL